MCMQLIMEDTESPSLFNGTLKFEHDDLHMQILFDGCDERQVGFLRSDGNWRWVRGPFTSIRSIVDALFEYEEEPTSRELQLMEDFVLAIGRLIETRFNLISLQVGRINKEWRGHIPRLPVMVVEAIDADKNRQPEPTNIYLMRHVNGLTKIGQSKNPKAREKTLQAEDPRLEMFFCCKADPSTEVRLHRIYDSLRVRGEWFNLEPHHVEWIVAVLTSMSKET